MNGAAHRPLQMFRHPPTALLDDGALAIASAVAYMPQHFADSGGDFASKCVQEKALHARGRERSRAKARRGRHPLIGPVPYKLFCVHAGRRVIAPARRKVIPMNSLSLPGMRSIDKAKCWRKLRP